MVAQIIYLTQLLYLEIILLQIQFSLGGSEFVLSARFSLPYSLWNGVDYANLGDLEKFQDDDGNPDPAKIEQEKFKWLEFYKINLAHGIQDYLIS